VKLSAPACVLSDAISLAGAIRSGANGPCIAHLATTRTAVLIRCTDKKVGTIATNVSAMIHEPGETAVSTCRLAALVSSFAADDIVEIEATAGTVNVVSGTSRLRLPTVAITELTPAIDIDQEIGRIELSSADCLHLLEPIAVADVARSRFYLAGVFWQSLDDRLVAVSTDGIRLIRTSIGAPKFSEDRTLIVPTEVGIAVRRLLQKVTASRVTLRRSRNFTARLIDSTFPAYESVIPTPSSNSVACDRLKLLAAISRLSAAATSTDTALIALSWGSRSCLDIHLARRPLDGADAIAADMHGSAEVALSLPQFAALLNEFRGEHIQLETADGQPVVIRGAGEKLALIVRSKWNFGSCREAA
jgi:DNA polymerase-3 subunit beta